MNELPISSFTSFWYDHVHLLTVSPIDKNVYVTLDDASTNILTESDLDYYDPIQVAKYYLILAISTDYTLLEYEITFILRSIYGFDYCYPDLDILSSLIRKLCDTYKADAGTYLRKIEPYKHADLLHKADSLSSYRFQYDVGTLFPEFYDIYASLSSDALRYMLYHEYFMLMRSYALLLPTYNSFLSLLDERKIMYSDKLLSRKYIRSLHIMLCSNLHMMFPYRPTKEELENARSDSNSMGTCS